MRIYQILSRSGHADFAADYECGHCGHLQHRSSGYDDTNFHVNVIPKFECESCGKTREGEPEPKPTVTLGLGKQWVVARHGTRPVVLAGLDRDPTRFTAKEARLFAIALLKAAEAVEEPTESDEAESAEDALRASSTDSEGSYSRVSIRL